jgi:hypothetical protein
MDNHKIRMSQIPAGTRSANFGLFTSQVSATAIFSLLVVLTVLVIGRV